MTDKEILERIKEIPCVLVSCQHPFFHSHFEYFVCTFRKFVEPNCDSLKAIYIDISATMFNECRSSGFFEEVKEGKYTFLEPKNKNMNLKNLTKNEHLAY